MHRTLQTERVLLSRLPFSCFHDHIPVCVCWYIYVKTANISDMPRPVSSGCLHVCKVESLRRSAVRLICVVSVGTRDSCDKVTQ